MKKKIFIFVTIITMMVICSYAFADTLDEQKKFVEGQISQENENLEKITDEKAKVLAEVEELNKSINEVQSEISDLQDKIDKVGESIEAKKKDLDEKQELLDERLSATYMNNNNTYLDALFNGGFINFMSNYDMIKQIAKYDNQLIEEVKTEKQELEVSKIEYENSKVKMQFKIDDLEKKKNERNEKIKTLTEEEQKAQASIQEKENEIARINEAVKRAAEDAARGSLSYYNGDGELIVDSEVPDVSAGGMTWPTRLEHRVNSVYAPGGRTDTAGYVGTPHKGLDIYAPEGTPIYAAKEGTVVYVNYSGYGGGWGLYVVVYHGDDSNGRPIYTRYAHASSIAPGIAVGTKVTTGTVIMYAGSTGASEGAHLHFEVCVGNMHNQVNPSLYLGITNAKGDHQ